MLRIRGATSIPSKPKEKDIYVTLQQRDDHRVTLILVDEDGKKLDFAPYIRDLTQDTATGKLYLHPHSGVDPAYCEVVDKVGRILIT